MKKTIKYRDLYSRLIKEFGLTESLKLINRVRKFSKKNLEALSAFMETETIPELTDGKTKLSELIDNEGMSPICAFIMIDWMEKKPEDAYQYMAKYRHSAPMPSLSDYQKELLKARLEVLRDENNLPAAEDEPHSETDIVIPECEEESAIISHGRPLNN